MAVPDYKLSAVLCGHSLDVRCVATVKEFCILSASRDRTTKLWHPEGLVNLLLFTLSNKVHEHTTISKTFLFQSKRLCERSYV